MVSERRSFLGLLIGGVTGGCLRLSGQETEAATETPGTSPTSTPSATATATDGRTATEPEEPETPASPEETPTGAVTLTTAWTADLKTVKPVDGVAYGHGGMERMAVGVDDGTARWRHEYEGGLAGATLPVAVDGTRVYLGVRSESGPAVQAVARDDGTETWRTTVDDKPRSAPLVAGEAVLWNLIGDDVDGTMVGFDRSTGERLWRQESGVTTVAGSRELGSVDESGDAYIVGGTNFDDARISRVDPTTGDRLWDWTERSPAGSPAYADRSVYVGMYDRFCAVDAETGETRWETETFDQNPTMPVVSDDTVYVGSRDTGVYAFSTADGSRAWRFQGDGPVEAVAGPAGGFVFAGTKTGTVYALHADDGRLAAETSFDGRVTGLRATPDYLLVSEKHSTHGVAVS